MPKVPDDNLRCVFFLYPDKRSAELGHPIGGTGFIVGVESTAMKHRWHLYGVTNYHNIAGPNPCPVIRLNGGNGKKADPIPFDVHDWDCHPDKCDISVVPLELDLANYELAFIPTSIFYAPGHRHWGQVGLGEDVFMMGRFVDHDGYETNAPLLRFGNISAMPTLMDQGRGEPREAYCLDLHSRGGYSGSPVMVYRSLGGDLKKALEDGRFDLGPSVIGFSLLLGIHRSQFKEWHPVYQKKGDDDLGKKPIAAAQAMSGITACVPAARILEAINMKKFAKAREKQDDKLAEQLRRTQGEKTAPESAIDEISTKFEQTVSAMLAAPPAPRRGKGTAKRSLAKKEK